MDEAGGPGGGGYTGGLRSAHAAFDGQDRKLLLKKRVLFFFSSFIYFSPCVCLQVSFFLFIVFVVYTMLPFSMRGAIMASAVTCTSHTVTLSVFLAAKVTELEPLVWQVRVTTADSWLTPRSLGGATGSVRNILLCGRYG